MRSNGSGGPNVAIAYSLGIQLATFDTMSYVESIRKEPISLLISLPFFINNSFTLYKLLIVPKVIHR